MTAAEYILLYYKVLLLLCLPCTPKTLTKGLSVVPSETTEDLPLQYVDLTAHQDEAHTWFLELCSSLRLVGRVRIALDGVNVTVCHLFCFIHVQVTRQVVFL